MLELRLIDMIAVSVSSVSSVVKSFSTTESTEDTARLQRIRHQTIKATPGSECMSARIRFERDFSDSTDYTPRPRGIVILSRLPALERPNPE
jgi:hypothetical protein